MSWDSRTCAELDAAREAVSEARRQQAAESAGIAFVSFVGVMAILIAAWIWAVP